MERTVTQIEYKTQWTKRIAVLLSIFYLANPLYRPLQVVLHETLAFFESPDTAIGHKADSLNSLEAVTYHEHKTLQFKYGHEIIDFVGLALDASEGQQSSDESIPESIKIDKHVVAVKLRMCPKKVIRMTKNYFFLIEKSKIGYPIKTKEPPRFS